MVGVVGATMEGVSNHIELLWNELRFLNGHRS
jgi:hypothetical protein